MDDYIDYKHNTSVLVPIPPCVYSVIPRPIRSSLLLDFPHYNFLDSGDASLEETANIATVSATSASE